MAPLPDVDLPAVSFPDLPAWVDTVVAWVHTVVKVKNWLLIAVVVMVIVCVAIDRLYKPRNRDRAGTGTKHADRGRGT